uniref:WLM domain-containing protein n=1 Tax=Craspedostauros australis TaxID=1486917 RepID=A0A7R9WPJ7_9STRA
MALVTPLQVANEIADKQSDPTIRGFDKEAERTQQQHKANARSSKQHWGSNTAQDRQYRFVQIEACTWHSFGHRPTESTPHAFEAFALLEKLSTDPGMVAIMRERELVVNTLGEMDPVDDRLMQKKQQQGGCLLGYNTNHGLRIDIKLRTDDLASLRPYHELAATLIHELSHNWVGEHNLLFWTNYAQMRAEYLYMHRNLQTSLLYRVQGKTTAQIAGWSKEALQNIPESILNELTREMAQHGLHPRMIENAIRVRCAELERENKMPPISGGQRLGGGGAAAADNVNANAAVSTNQAMSARERALAAAERRAREQRERSNK